MRYKLFVVLILVLGNLTESKKLAKDLNLKNRKKKRTSENARNKEDAERQEKMHELMKKKGSKNYEMFNRNLDKAALELIAKHFKNLKSMRQTVLERQQKRKMGIFKFDKKITKSQIFMACLTTILIIFFTFAINISFTKAKKYFDENILYSVTETTKDLLFIIFFLTLLSVISNQNILINLQNHVNIEQITIGGLSIIIIWILRAVIKIIYCQWKVNKWDFYESLYPEKVKIVKEFSELCNLDLRNKKEKLRLKELSWTLEYFNLRDDFIKPHYLPSVGESVFRQDFPFSDYLCLCLAKNLRVYFRIKKSSFFTIMFILVYMMICSSFQNEIYMSLILSLLPLLCAFTLLKARQRITEVYRACLTRSKDQDLVQFAQIRNNFLLEFYPNFLKNVYKKMGLGFDIKSYKSKQEELYWLDSPSFMLNFIHQCEIVLISTFVISFPILSFLWNNSLIGFWIATMSMICHSYVALFFVPGILIKFTISSNVILMRDFRLASQAINLQRRRLYPVYRTFYR